MKRLLAALVLLLLAAAAFYFLRPEGGGRPSAVALPAKAFGGLEWGVSADAVTQTLGAALTPPSRSRTLYTPPPGIDPLRYKTLEHASVPYAGREAAVDYVFLDDKLFAYYVFVSDTNEEALDVAMRAQLAREFGSGFSELTDDGPLKLIWQNPKTIVNYWLFQDVISLRPKSTAAYGVVYRPVEESVGATN